MTTTPVSLWKSHVPMSWLMPTWPEVRADLYRRPRVELNPYTDRRGGVPSTPLVHA